MSPCLSSASFCLLNYTSIPMIWGCFFFYMTSFLKVKLMIWSYRPPNLYSLDRMAVALSFVSVARTKQKLISTFFFALKSENEFSKNTYYLNKTKAWNILIFAPLIGQNCAFRKFHKWKYFWLSFYLCILNLNFRAKTIEIWGQNQSFATYTT